MYNGWRQCLGVTLQNSIPFAVLSETYKVFAVVLLKSFCAAFLAIIAVYGTSLETETHKTDKELV